jgi:hypothetical protein
MDYAPHPTHPLVTVPYFLTPLWDAGAAARAQADRKAALSAPAQTDAGRVPRELREKLKKAKAAKGLLRDLEEEVRRWVVGWERKQREAERDGLGDANSSDDDFDEVVFVGRNGTMHDMPASRKRRALAAEAGKELRREKLVFDSLADDRGASFGYVLHRWSAQIFCLCPFIDSPRRWLVHSIATYYGLRTWSVTVGNPARREAYVGIKTEAGQKSLLAENELPRPLWVLV